MRLSSTHIYEVLRLYLNNTPSSNGTGDGMATGNHVEEGHDIINVSLLSKRIQVIENIKEEVLKKVKEYGSTLVQPDERSLHISGRITPWK